MSYKQIISQILCLCIFSMLIACVDASNSVSPSITISAAATEDFPATTPDQVGLDGQKLNALSHMIEISRACSLFAMVIWRLKTIIRDTTEIYCILLLR